MSFAMGASQSKAFQGGEKKRLTLDPFPDHIDFTLELVAARYSSDEYTIDLSNGWRVVALPWYTAFPKRVIGVELLEGTEENPRFIHLSTWCPHSDTWYDLGEAFSVESCHKDEGERLFYAY